MSNEYENLPCKGKFCGRPGLPILPMRVSYVPEGRNDLPDGVYMSPELYHKTMRGGAYMLRAITAGYVFVWDPRRTYGWRAFAATAGGQFKEVEVDDAARPSEEPTFTCTREGHGLEAALINIARPERANRPVWVGYSRVWWTEDIRKELARDKAWREKVMVAVDAKAVHGGGHPDRETGCRVNEDGKQLQDHSIEFRDAATARKLFENTLTPGAMGFGGRAAEMAAKMHALSPKGGIMLALPDPVGILADISTWRNKNMAELAAYHLDPERMWDVSSAELIDGVRKQTRPGTDEYRRMSDRLDLSRVTDVLTKNKAEIEKFRQPIEGAADDWGWWFGRDRFWLALDTYSPVDSQTGARLEEDFALSVDGAGAVTVEHGAIDAVLKEENVYGKYRAMWRALANNDDKLLEFLKKEVTTKFVLDRANDIRNFCSSFKQWMQDRRGSGAAAAATATVRPTTAIVGRFVSTQLLRYTTTATRPLNGRIYTRVAATMAYRMDIVLSVQTHSTTVPRFISEMHQITFGTLNYSISIAPPTEGYFASNPMTASWMGSHIETTSEVQFTYLVPEQIAARPGPAAAPSSSPAGASPPGGPLVHRPPGTALPGSLPVPSVHTPSPLGGLVRWAKSLDGASSAAGGVLTLLALNSSVNDLNKSLEKKDNTEQRKAIFGIVSGVLGVGALVSEVIAGGVGARVTQNSLLTMNLRLSMRLAALRTAGAAFAAAATLTDGVNSALDAIDQYDVKNYEAGNAYLASSFFLTLSGLSGVAAAVIGVGGALTAAGVVAGSGAAGTLVALTQAGTVLLGIPVWGWIVIGLAALAIGLYFKFWGDSAKETDLEIWYTRSRFRSAKYQEADEDRPVFESREHEIESFNMAVFGVKANLEWRGFMQGEFVGRDRVVLELVLPGYGKGSDYAYSLKFTGPGRSEVVASRASRLSQDPDLQPRPPSQQTVSAAPARDGVLDKIDDYVRGMGEKPGWARGWQWLREDRSAPVEFVTEPFDPAVDFTENEGYAVLKAELLVDDDVFNGAVLKVEYWPDAERMPEVVSVPTGGGGANFITAKD